MVRSCCNFITLPYVTSLPLVAASTEGEAEEWKTASNVTSASPSSAIARPRGSAKPALSQHALSCFPALALRLLSYNRDARVRASSLKYSSLSALLPDPESPGARKRRPRGRSADVCARSLRVEGASPPETVTRCGPKRTASEAGCRNPLCLKLPLANLLVKTANARRGEVH